MKVLKQKEQNLKEKDEQFQKIQQKKTESRKRN